MKIKVILYSDEIHDAYNEFLKKSKKSMLFHSLSYRKFLKITFPDCEDYYFCAFKGKEIQAILPIFIKSGKYGKIANSLPFFGSHGGIIYRGDKINENCKIKLLDSLDKLCQLKDIVTCTIINTPFEKDESIYSLFKSDLYDERIGQITKLPECNDEFACEEKLLRLIHPKTRNHVRKAFKSNFKIVVNNSEESFNILYEIHKENILSINGKPKRKIIFKNIQEAFEPKKDYNIFTAVYNDRIVSSMLIFYHKNIVEYFCPATKSDFRDKNPLSGLIFSAMKDSILNKKSQYWNWGGTWLTQKSVYNFKARWGTIDYPYKYYIKTNSQFNKDEYSASDLDRNYENFYFMPYSLCKK